jgi:hypothetical protein
MGMMKTVSELSAAADGAAEQMALVATYFAPL